MVAKGQRRSSSALRIIVLGYVVRGPVGGMVWSNMQFVMGLARLGHEVFFVEDSDDYPSCYDPSRGLTDTDPSYGIRFAANLFRTIGLAERWAYFDAHTNRWLGPAGTHIEKTCGEADVVLNLCGMNPLRPWLLEIPVRVYVDEDPAFTQIRHLTDPAARSRALEHTAFFSFAENIGQPQCKIPEDGLPWQTLRQPVVLDAAPVSTPCPQGMFTTVMQWKSYPEREYRGVRYGMKSESFGAFLDLPRHTGPVLELAVSGKPPIHLLSQKGWNVVDAQDVTRDPWTYESYIRASKGEFSVAKEGYVVSRSGWFSERSVTYLATGRPVIVQETGFSGVIESGRGIMSFSTFDDACSAVENVSRDYRGHCMAAREAAETWFDSSRILQKLIEQSFSAPICEVL